MAEFSVEHADWALDGEALHDLRDRVFVREQHVPPEEEWDELDPACQHVLALDADGVPIGCGRLTPEGKIGRMAVLPEWRGRGVGSAMLRALLERARERGWDTIHLHAQASAIEFYRRHGFEGHGERFMEAGIEHLGMRITLAPLTAPPQRRGTPPPRPDPVELACNDSESLKQAVRTLLADTRHRLCVHSHALLPGILDDEDVLAELRRIATSGRLADLRFLLLDAEAVLRQGHRLVELSQRLDTSMHLRELTEREDRNHASAFVLNDAGGFLLLPAAGVPDGRGSTHAPGRHATLMNYFDEVWERSLPAVALRKLDL